MSLYGYSTAVAGVYKYIQENPDHDFLIVDETGQPVPVSALKP